MHYITKYCKNEKFSIESCTCYNPNFHYKLLIQKPQFIINNYGILF